MDEAQLCEKLSRIEAFFAGATKGEPMSAAEARRRIRARLSSLERQAPIEEFRFTIEDTWARKLFVALLCRYGLKPYAHKGQRRTTLMVQAPEPFVRETLYPEYEELSEAMWTYLNEVIERVLADVIHADRSKAAEVVAPAPRSTDGAVDIDDGSA